MTSLQDSPGVTPYPPEAVAAYLAAGLWGRLRIEQLVADTAADRPGATAVVDADGSTDYAGLVRRVERAAVDLQVRGLRTGQTVVLQMPNTVDAIAVLLGCFRLGVRPVLALAAHRGQEIAGFIEAGRATAWILGDLPGVDAEALVADVRARLAHRDLPVLRRTGSGESAVGESALDESGDDSGAGRGPASGAVPQRHAGADELAFFQLSGGTTGAGKLIPRAHREYAYSFLRSNELCGIDAQSVLVIPLPVTHNFPMSSPGFLGVLAAGGTVVLCPHGDPATVCAAVQEHRGTHLIAVPPLAQVLLDSTARHDADLSSLRRVLVGGARLSPAVARRIHTELAPLQQVYGMAEGLVCYTDPADDLETIVTTQGRPMSALDEVRVVEAGSGGSGGSGGSEGSGGSAGPEGSGADVVEVPAGAVGELQVRGPYTIRGYYFGGPREQAAFTADGFYRTGDLVRRDATGSITVVGRTKEQINRGGEKISPAEVEDALLRHPRVHDACVVGEPDDLLGERLVAYVVPRPDEADRDVALDRRVLRRHLLAQSLAPFKMPDGFRVVPHLPTTAVGKIARRRVGPDASSPGAGAPTGSEPGCGQAGPGETLDVLGVGFGPANMALAIALRETNEVRAAQGARPLRAAFVDAAARTSWHEGMLFEDASMQVAFAKDLATMRNPRSDFTFLQFLAERARLADFVNRGSMSPLRVEFVEYLRWAAAKLRDDVTYGARVEAVTPVLVDGAVTGYDVDIRRVDGAEGVAGETRVTRRVRHVVLAAGLQPRLPAQVRPGPRVWHSSEHLFRADSLDPRCVRDVVVVGGGQSAAEVVLHLRGLLGDDARVHAVHGRFGYSPADSSPYVNRIFDAESVDALFDAPESQRSRVDALHAGTNDSVVAPATLQTLYDLEYRDRWLGRERLVWHRCTRVLGARDTGDAVEVELFDALADATTTLRADALVCASGYRPLDPGALLGEHAGLLRRDPQGRPVARRDYAATWQVPARGQLFLVGQTRHQHGVSATLLSNAAVRAGEIAAAIAAESSAESSAESGAESGAEPGAEIGAGVGVEAHGPVDPVGQVGAVGAVGALGAVQVAS